METNASTLLVKTGKDQSYTIYLNRALPGWLPAWRRTVTSPAERSVLFLTAMYFHCMEMTS